MLQSCGDVLDSLAGGRGEQEACLVAILRDSVALQIERCQQAGRLPVLFCHRLPQPLRRFRGVALLASVCVQIFPGQGEFLRSVGRSSSRRSDCSAGSSRGQGRGRFVGAGARLPRSLRWSGCIVWGACLPPAWNIALPRVLNRRLLGLSACRRSHRYGRTLRGQ